MYVSFGTDDATTAVQSAPKFVQATKSLVAGDAGAAASQAYDAQREVADQIPVVQWFLDIESYMLSIADALGIGPEVRQLYKNAGIGAQIGGAYAASPVPNAIAAATAGTAFQGLGMWAAAAGVGVGALIGGVLAILDIFDDEDAENAARKEARRKAKAAALAKMLARLDLTGLVNEQKDLASRARSMASMMGVFLPKGMSNPQIINLQKQAGFADKLAKLFSEVGKKLNANEMKVFVGSTNIARWRMFLDNYLQVKLPKIDALIAKVKKQQSVGIGIQAGPNFQLMPLEALRAEYIEITGKLLNNIMLETVKMVTDPALKKSAPSPAITAASSKKLPANMMSFQVKPLTKWSPAVAISIGAIVAAAGVAGAVYMFRKKRRAA